MPARTELTDCFRCEAANRPKSTSGGNGSIAVVQADVYERQQWPTSSLLERT